MYLAPMPDGPSEAVPFWFRLIAWAIACRAPASLNSVSLAKLNSIAGPE